MLGNRYYRAGDAFAGSFLSKLLTHSNLDEITEELSEMATFATNYVTNIDKNRSYFSYLTEEGIKI